MLMFDEEETETLIPGADTSLFMANHAKVPEKAEINVKRLMAVAPTIFTLLLFLLLNFGIRLVTSTIGICFTAKATGYLNKI